MRASWLAWLLLYVATLVIAPARARASDLVVAVVGDSRSQAVLIGPSGQLYYPEEDPGIWRRQHGGGVAADVLGALRAAQGELLVAGDMTPLYRFRDGAWHFQPVATRGPVVLPGPGSVPAVAVGAQILEWQGSGFRRQASASGPITAFYAAPGGITYVAVGSQLESVRANGAAVVVHHSLPVDDPIILFAGHGARVYAISRRGAILRLGKTVARSVARAPDVQALVPHAARVSADGTLWLIGVAAAAAATPAQSVDADVNADPGLDRQPLCGPPTDLQAAERIVLARIQNDELVVAEVLDRLDPGDRLIALTREADGGMLTVSAAGVVRYREPGAAWINGRIIQELPELDKSRVGALPAISR